MQTAGADDIVSSLIEERQCNRLVLFDENLASENVLWFYY